MAETLGQAVLEVGIDTTKAEAGVKSLSGTLAATSASLPPLVPRVDGTLAQAQFVTLKQQLARNAQASPLLLPVGLQQQRVDELVKGNKGIGLSFAELGKAAAFAAGAVGLMTSATELANFSIRQNVAYQDAAAAVETLGVNSVVLGGALRNLSGELNNNVSTVDLLKASYDVASSGFANTADAVDILKASALGATGGFSDINTVADATTSVLNAYGLSATNATKVVDGFIQTQNDGKIVVAQIAQEIGRVAPVAAAAGVSFQELGAAVSVATAQGVPAGSTYAGLRQAITAILKPTSEAVELASQLGLSFNAQALKAQGLGVFLKNVADATGGSADANVKLFGSVEAVAAIQPLLNDGLQTYNRFLDNNITKTGQAAEAADKASNTLSGSVKRLQNAVSDLATQSNTALAPVAKIINLAAEATKVFPSLGEGIAKAFSPIGFAVQEAEKLINILNKFPALKGIIESGGDFLNKTGKAVQDLGGPPASNVGSPEDIAAFNRELAAIRDKRAKDDANRIKAADFATRAAERDIIKPAEKELRNAQRLSGIDGIDLQREKQAIELEKLRETEGRNRQTFKGLGGNAAVEEGSEAAITAKATLEASGIDIRKKIIEGADALRKAGEEIKKRIESASKAVEQATKGVQQAQESRANATAAASDIASAGAIQEDREVLFSDISKNLASGRIDQRKLAQRFGLGFNPNAGGFAEGIDRLDINKLSQISQATSPLADSQQAVVDAQKELVKTQDELSKLTAQLEKANGRDTNLEITVPVGKTETVYLP